ncbi:hypothetical protein BDY19DRAFT_997180 [Irpex rosettiformis]|uniref:Uncharacterized protein n=1 Tax=Irpex rosettiformis TaxID=378272 RepID=A0ACB8TSW6_9APHY|nr:hypothetical protein BDY19DRAFT_997180 [Irpex rosettiformis]
MSSNTNSWQEFAHFSVGNYYHQDSASTGSYSGDRVHEGYNYSNSIEYYSYDFAWNPAQDDAKEQANYCLSQQDYSTQEYVSANTTTDPNYAYPSQEVTTNISVAAPREYVADFDYTGFGLEYSQPLSLETFDDPALQQFDGAQTLSVDYFPSEGYIPYTDTQAGSTLNRPQPDNQLRATPYARPLSKVHTFEYAGFDSEEALQRDGIHSEYDLGQGCIVPQATYNGTGVRSPSMKPPIEFKAGEKAGINLFEVIHRPNPRRPLKALDSEVELGGPQVRKSTYIHVRINWPGYFPHQLKVKLSEDTKTVKTSDDVLWVAVKVAETINEFMANPPKRLASTGGNHIHQEWDLTHFRLADIWLFRMVHVGSNNWQPVLLVVPPVRSQM